MIRTYELTFFIHDKTKNYPIEKVRAYEKSKSKAVVWASYEASKLTLQYQTPVSLLKVKEVK